MPYKWISGVHRRAPCCGRASTSPAYCRLWDSLHPLPCRIDSASLHRKLDMFAVAEICATWTLQYWNSAPPTRRRDSEPPGLESMPPSPSLSPSPSPPPWRRRHSTQQMHSAPQPWLVAAWTRRRRDSQLSAAGTQLCSCRDSASHQLGASCSFPSFRPPPSS